MPETETAVQTDPAARDTVARPASGARPRSGPLPASFRRSATLVLALIAVWWVLTEYVLQKPRIYPTPRRVAEELARIVSGEGPIGSTYAHAGATLVRLLIAVGVAFVLGTLLGALAGRVKWVFDFSNSLVWIALAVPSVVWVFVFLVVFGITDLVPVVALVVLLTAPVFIGTAEGVKSVDNELIVMARSYRASRWTRLTELYLPSIVPFMLANARIAVALGIKIVIIAEVVGLPNGIGLLVKYWTDKLYMAPVVAWGIILIGVGLLFDRFVFGYFERRVARWSAESTGAVLHVE